MTGTPKPSAVRRPLPLVDQQPLGVALDRERDRLGFAAMEPTRHQRAHHVRAGGARDGQPARRLHRLRAGQARSDDGHLAEHRVGNENVGPKPVDELQPPDRAQVDQRASVSDDDHVRPTASPAAISRSTSSSSISNGDTECPARTRTRPAACRRAPPPWRSRDAAAGPDPRARAAAGRRRHPRPTTACAGRPPREARLRRRTYDPRSWPQGSTRLRFERPRAPDPRPPHPRHRAPTPGKPWPARCPHP